ncbi:MAG: extracellular solute-binding protein [Akkermansiaceae bacterium]|jgi:iron(III) transport system substrate-binding protein|nr:extracellular solute-binding protein [Akkermansiaceae bacterium]
MKTTLLTLAIATLGLVPISAAELRIYTERHYDADLKVFERFTAESGIEVKLVKAGANELIARIESEKASPQADLLVTVDAATLDRAATAGLLQPHGSEALAGRFPAGLAAADGTWVPFTMRARVIVHAKDRVENPPTTYADLADPRFRGNILIRSSTSPYNQSLLASILAADGPEVATAWATGVKNNMARPPQGGDRDQVRAIALGLGDIAVTNSYYLGLLATSEDPKDRAALDAIRIVFPNQSDRGTHINISGGGIIKGAANSAEALKFMEFVTSPEVQALYQTLTAEFAVTKDIEPTEIQKSWGSFKPDFTNLHQLAENTEEAIKIFNLVGWQ